MNMRKKLSLLLVLPFLLTGAVSRCAAATSPTVVEVKAGIDISSWDALLKKYVDTRGYVNYAAWKKSTVDMAALDLFLHALGQPAQPAATGNDRAAILINAYNAFTISWILQNFPAESIRTLPDSFTARRHLLGAGKVSLDDIEGALRQAIGFRTHPAISCASRSCPPLSRDAYSGARLDQQTDTAFQQWLARPDLNQFLPERKQVKISRIFDWFAADFTPVGGVSSLLARYAPAADENFLNGGLFTVDYLPYDWGLNDQGGHGAHYSKLNLLWDKIAH